MRLQVLYLSVKKEKKVLSRSLSPEMLAEDKQLHRAACRIPTYIPTVPHPYKVYAHSVVFNLSQINARQHEWFNSTVCLHEKSPNISFAFLFKKISQTNLGDDDAQNSCLHTSECFYMRINSDSPGHIRLDNLLSNSMYSTHLVIYSQVSHHRSAVISPAISFSTACEAAPAPADLHCVGINETALKVLWRSSRFESSTKILYEIYVDLEVKPLTELYAVNRNFSYIYIHTDLYSKSYNYTVRVLSINCTVFPAPYSEAKLNQCSPLQSPVELVLEYTTDMQALVFWKPPSDGSVNAVFVEWIMVEDIMVSNTWSESLLFSGNDSFRYTVTDMIPNTGYSFRTRQQYVGHRGFDGWRYSNPVNGITMPGAPSFPKQVKILSISRQAYLTWTAPNDNGAILKYYIVSYRNRSYPNATRTLYGSWTPINNSARSTRWKIQKLEEGKWYEFRVSAANEVGEGDTSKPSSAFQYVVYKELEEDLTLYIVVGVTVGIVMVIIVFILCACIRCGKVAETNQSPLSSEITTIHLSYGADLQLAQIRNMTELANARGFSSVPQDYMDLLPLFPRERLSLTDFLGKGAFGEVFKGIAYHVDGSEKKVAVKTLREGSTDSEKCEFLMEAYFMSNFNHKNILSLFGVCLDNEPQYLILELMEGGDLLHYLRDARPTPIKKSELTSTELLDICLDIAAGCKYLEEQRFIHRDLAARNCLVSTKLPQADSRVVKIGDFGLARDIYKTDYYHKAGEGLLPVRWMSPESLVDNVYSTQSDVWSFGIVLWEIMTYGQQPYPAFTNFEVLQHVRTGGRLPIPDNCPNDIYALMMKCWNKTSSLRPSFNWALQWLAELKDRDVFVPNSFGNTDVNYTTVTTSSEDFIETEMQDLNPNVTLTSRSLDDCYYNDAFNSQDWDDQSNNDLTDLDSDDVATTSLDIRIFTPQAEHASTSTDVNVNSYLRISLDDPRLLSTESMGGLIDNSIDNTYLSFHPSRNTNQKGNVARSLTESYHEMHVSSNEELNLFQSQPNHLLPYIGDLPITDEERLKRKQEWSRQKKLSAETLKDSAENDEDVEYTTAHTSMSPLSKKAHLRQINLMHK